jgi:lipid II:glycine glycyltransferase (peptidoglycan interpeptide bridge formation enzyme)
MSAAFQKLRHDGFVSVFLRMHPLLNKGWAEVPEGLLLPHGETVVINLQDSPEEMWKQTRSGHRNEINRAKRDGQEFLWDREWTHIEDVSRLYLETMKRVGASDYYLFPLDYFHRLRTSLGDHGALATVRINGEIAAGAVFTECEGLAQYHLSGSDLRYRKQQPTKFLLHEVRRLGHESGWRQLHLGGGAGSSEDSLFRFKAGFSNSRARFESWRCILDPEAYRQHCEERGIGGEDSLEGFFPLYRKPI